MGKIKAIALAVGACALLIACEPSEKDPISAVATAEQKALERNIALIFVSATAERAAADVVEARATATAVAQATIAAGWTPTPTPDSRAKNAANCVNVGVGWEIEAATGNRIYKVGGEAIRTAYAASGDRGIRWLTTSEYEAFRSAFLAEVDNVDDLPEKWCGAFVRGE